MSNEQDTAPTDTEDESAPLITDVQLAELDDLLPYVNNPKQHPDRQVEKIAASIRQYGFDQPIVVEKDGTIIKGHGRYQAAQRLDLERVPVIFREDLNNAQAKGSRIADNKTNLDSGWDIDTLSVEFEELKSDSEFDIGDTGFEPDEVDAIIEQADLDIDEFFEAEEAGEFVDDGQEGASPDHVPAGEFECPACGHTFAPTMDEMGEGVPPEEFEEDTESEDSDRSEAEAEADD